MWLRHIHHPRDYLSISEKDGVWDSSYVSTGVYDESVNKTLGEAVRAGDDNTQSDLGNGEASYGYAVKGVEFTYLKVADIVQFTESERDGVTYNHVEVLYGIDKTIGADLLNALGLQGGDKRYTNADHLDATKYFYQSDVLIAALALALETNSTSVKNALESYIAANGGTAVPLTDAYGKSEAKDLELGLYLVVETKVPEMVTSTCNPFFVSIPMTSVDGTNATDGYFVKAELNEEEGIYYVVDHVADEADATHFIPVENENGEGLVIVKGLEDDSYTVTEVRTDNGYTLLKDDIKIVISQVETVDLCDIYASDVLGLIQNDPRYATIINDTGDLKNMPQKHLEHHLLTASATVDGNKVNMLEDDGSVNASVPLKVVNTRGFDLPQTGDNGTWMFSVVGILMMAGAACFLLVLVTKKRTAEQ